MAPGGGRRILVKGESKGCAVRNTLFSSIKLSPAPFHRIPPDPVVVEEIEVRCQLKPAVGHSDPTRPVLSAVCSCKLRLKVNEWGTARSCVTCIGTFTAPLEEMPRCYGLAQTAYCLGGSMTSKPGNRGMHDINVCHEDKDYLALMRRKHERSCSLRKATCWALVMGCFYFPFRTTSDFTDHIATLRRCEREWPESTVISLVIPHCGIARLCYTIPSSRSSRPQLALDRSR
jgi:hypothetical protein